MNDGTAEALADKGEVTKELDVLEDAIIDSLSLASQMVDAIASVTRGAPPEPTLEKRSEETVVAVAASIRSIRFRLEASNDAMRSTIARISI